MMFRKWQARQALRKVARQRGITLKQVIRDIDETIQEAYTTAVREDNQAVLDAWREIPCRGALPTALELAACLAQKLSES